MNGLRSGSWAGLYVALLDGVKPKYFSVVVLDDRTAPQLAILSRRVMAATRAAKAMTIPSAKKQV
jgi:hypothetical protein